MITITPDSMGLDQVISCSIPVKVKKFAPTWAKDLTPADDNKCFVSPHRAGETPEAGFVWTKEGKVSFIVFDEATGERIPYILCRGVEGEFWPMARAEFDKIKSRDPKHPTDDKDGWGTYVNTGFSFAIKMDQSFKVQIYDGSVIEAEAGDFLLFSPDRKSTWAVGASIFANSWAPAE